MDILRGIPASRRPSRGYVSIVVRLGRVLRPLPPLELASLRSPRITYKLAQRLVRSGVRDEDLLRQLGDALANPPIDGRRTRHHRPRGVDLSVMHALLARSRPSAAPGTPSAAGSEDSPQADTESAARLIEAMLASQRALSARLATRASTRDDRPPVILAGQSLAALGRSIREYRQSTAASPRPDASAERAADAAARAALRHVETSLVAALHALRRTPPEPSTEPP